MLAGPPSQLHMSVDKPQSRDPDLETVTSISDETQHAAILITGCLRVIVAKRRSACVREEAARLRGQFSKSRGLYRNAQRSRLETRLILSRAIAETISAEAVQIFHTNPIAATKIQTTWRAFRARKNISRLRKALEHRKRRLKAQERLRTAAATLREQSDSLARARQEATQRLQASRKYGCHKVDRRWRLEEFNRYCDKPPERGSRDELIQSSTFKDWDKVTVRDDTWVGIPASFQYIPRKQVPKNPRQRSRPGSSSLPSLKVVTSHTWVPTTLLKRVQVHR